MHPRPRPPTSGWGRPPPPPHLPSGTGTNNHDLPNDLNYRPYQQQQQQYPSQSDIGYGFQFSSPSQGPHTSTHPGRTADRHTGPVRPPGPPPRPPKQLAAQIEGGSDRMTQSESTSSASSTVSASSVIYSQGPVQYDGSEAATSRHPPRTDEKHSDSKSSSVDMYGYARSDWLRPRPGHGHGRRSWRPPERYDRDRWDRYDDDRSYRPQRGRSRSPPRRHQDEIEYQPPSERRGYGREHRGSSPDRDMSEQKSSMVDSNGTRQCTHHKWLSCTALSRRAVCVAEAFSEFTCADPTFLLTATAIATAVPPYLRT